VTCLHLSSEQLSHQEHYDFGMRTLKAILTAAGEIKRETPLELEEIIILRALCEINLPKYTSSDIPLFLNISNDLFPNINLPEKIYDDLKENLLKICSENGLSSESAFILKCFQLYETLQTRHGLMLIGSAFSGKSTVLTCLKQALNQMNKTDCEVSSVTIYKINPKSMSINHLYGIFDADTKLWEDGVLPIIMRECWESTEKERKWVVFDGPVDSVWVENLNTVLDDNKKLCLSSGEIIKLNARTSIIFEVDNLKFASPATISRCGMIYLETKILGWEALFKTFLWRLQDTVLSEFLEKTFRRIIEVCVIFFSIYGKIGVYFIDLAILNTCLEIIEILIMNETSFNEEKLKNYMIFSVIWSFGVSFDENDRSKFSVFFVDLIHGIDVNEKYNLGMIEFESKVFVENFPVNNVKLFEVIFDREKKQWKSWISTLSDFSISKSIDFYDLIIPNNDYIRNAFFLNLMVSNQKRFLLYGPPGERKKTIVFNVIIPKF